MKPLNENINCYPSFQPNQVLTNVHLNRLGDYLEQQDRLTRRKLIGTGIACGLEVSFTPKTGDKVEITISRGVGISSQGFLIRLDQATCTPDESPCSLDKSTAAPEESPGNEDECICTHWRSFTDKAGYEAFIVPGSDPKEQYEIMEILTDPGDTYDETTINELTTGDIENKVVLLYLEIIEEKTDKCLDESCDEKGKSWKFTLRKLLVDTAVMDNILENPGGNIQSEGSAEDPLEEVFIGRFGFVSDSQPLKLDGIEDLPAFVKGYWAAVEQGGARLEKALHGLYRQYKPLFDRVLESRDISFDGFDKTAGTLLEMIKDSHLTVQYVYDFINDVKDAYNELSAKLPDLIPAGCANPGSFPGHLMLGRLRETVTGWGGQPDDYRHSFTPAFLHRERTQSMLIAEQLMIRLALMIKYFYWENLQPELLNGKTDVRITPGKDCSAPLGDRAIPFYYRADSEPPLSDYWDVESGKRNKQPQLPGYHNAEHKPLLYGICQYPKLRIEGHVGMTLEEAMKQLTALRKAHNLSFDMITLKLDSAEGFDIDSIYPPDSNLIADLQAIYLVHRNDLVCSIQDITGFLYGGPLNRLLEIFVFHNAHNFFPNYKKALEALEAQLPEDLKEFDINGFKAAYNVVFSMSVELKCRISSLKEQQEERRGCLTSIPIFGKLIFAGRYAKSAQASRSSSSASGSISPDYFQLFVDNLIEDYPKVQLETIYNIFMERVKILSLFSSFNEKIHGMEHIAGTNKGGTFILVYHEKNPDFQVVADFYLPYKISGRFLEFAVQEVSCGENKVKYSDCQAILKEPGGHGPGDPGTTGGEPLYKDEEQPEDKDSIEKDNINKDNIGKDDITKDKAKQ